MIPKEDIEYLAKIIKEDRFEHDAYLANEPHQLKSPSNQAESILKGLMGRGWRKLSDDQSLPIHFSEPNYLIISRIPFHKELGMDGDIIFSIPKEAYKDISDAKYILSKLAGQE